MTEEEFRLFVEQKALELLAHCDSVEILVSVVQGGKTRCIKSGGGDWYARQGMAHEFINEDIASDTAAKLGLVLNPPDEGDAWKAPVGDL